ncbi:putative vacuolar protease A [Mycena venus]|uniref:Putative vacuolar protease A n=1 Tax=Mycena venus TaxID=2733690 RepID=A0A8H6U324_9AGAR|nr:putative vacuolar protease A [Mycena venus]
MHFNLQRILLIVGIASIHAKPTPLFSKPTTLSLSSRKIGGSQLGTPPQDFTVVFDTGSDELVIPGTNCTTSCANQKKFDPTQSSTFKLNTGDGIFEESFLTGGDASPWGLKDWSMSLIEVSDTMTVGGLSVSNVSFLLIQNQSQYICEPFIRSMAFIWPPHSVGGAEMTLGGVDSSKFTSQTTFAPIVADGHGAWILNSSGIAVNGQTNDVLAVHTEVLFDTGTTNVFLPLAMAEALYAFISPEIQPNPTEPGAWGIPCSKVGSLPASVDFTLQSVAGTAFNVTIPSSELSVGPFIGNNSLCQAAFNSWPANFTIPPIIGNSLFKHYYTTWDSGNLALGFAPICECSFQLGWIVEFDLNSIIQNLRNGLHGNT